MPRDQNAPDGRLDESEDSANSLHSSTRPHHSFRTEPSEPSLQHDPSRAELAPLLQDESPDGTRAKTQKSLCHIKIVWYLYEQLTATSHLLIHV